MIHPELLKLRQQLDSIDNQLHQLIMQRIEVVEQVGELKRNNPSFVQRGQFMYPGREAAIVRRLAAQHRGALPVSSLVQLWRELMMATLYSVEQPFSYGYLTDHLTTHDHNAPPSVALLARDHFGTAVPATAFDSPIDLIAAIQQQIVNYAVLPWPAAGNHWWTALLHQADHPSTPLQIFFALPFCVSSTALTPQAAVLGPLPVDDLTGEDDSLLAVALHPTFPIAKLAELQSLSVAVQLLDQATDAGGQPWALLQLDDACLPDSACMQQVMQLLGGHMIAPPQLLGVYPRPLA
jgi:chorismate mutase-like protein